MKEKKQKRRKDYWLFCMFRPVIKLFCPKYKFYGMENLPEESCIIVGNHCHMYGPLAGELSFPGRRRMWCASQMLNLKEVPAYSFQDFWYHKPKWTRPFYKLLSYVIALPAMTVFCNARTIPVYRDNRIINTFRRTIECLEEGENIIIFPEHYTPRNNIIYDFQTRFIDVARLNYRKTGKALTFVPMYIAPKLKGIYFGKPTVFDPNAPIEQERERIAEHLMTEITEIGVNLPLHTVVPYPNMSKKHYPKNKEV